MGLVLIGLGAGFERIAISIVVAGKPKVVDTDPHGTKKFNEPLLLLVRHGAMVAYTVLLLEIAPFLRELATK
jgi:hypothetical protein